MKCHLTRRKQKRSRLHFTRLFGDRWRLVCSATSSNRLALTDSLQLPQLQCIKCISFIFFIGRVFPSELQPPAKSCRSPPANRTPPHFHSSRRGYHVVYSVCLSRCYVRLLALCISISLSSSTSTFRRAYQRRLWVTDPHVIRVYGDVGGERDGGWSGREDGYKALRIQAARMAFFLILDVLRICTF